MKKNKAILFLLSVAAFGFMGCTKDTDSDYFDVQVTYPYVQNDTKYAMHLVPPRSLFNFNDGDCAIVNSRLIRAKVEGWPETDTSRIATFQIPKASRTGITDYKMLFPSFAITNWEEGEAVPDVPEFYVPQIRRALRSNDTTHFQPSGYFVPVATAAGSLNPNSGHIASYMLKNTVAVQCIRMNVSTQYSSDAGNVNQQAITFYKAVITSLNNDYPLWGNAEIRNAYTDQPYAYMTQKDGTHQSITLNMNETVTVGLNGLIFGFLTAPMSSNASMRVEIMYRLEDTTLQNRYHKLTYTLSAPAIERSKYYETTINPDVNHLQKRNTEW